MGVVVDSMNPIVTGADTPAYLRAFKRLELLVVIDVSMTETAELAHYILPAATQYEKWEAAFLRYRCAFTFLSLEKSDTEAP